MDVERIEVAHNKKLTVTLCLVLFLFIAGFVACLVFIGLNFAEMANSTGTAVTVLIIIALSVCTLLFVALLVCYLPKLRRKIIFVADENGITDYSRFVVLKPIPYDEIKSIGYRGFLQTDEVETGQLRRLKIVLRDPKEYARKLNFVQKASLFADLTPVQLHLFCAKGNLKELADKLKRNLEIYNDEQIK